MSYFEYKIRFHQRGLKLLDFLEQQFTYFDRKGWEEELKKKNLFLNENLASGNEILEIGNIVKFSLENYIEPEVNRDYSIIYEDEFLLAVNKPANLPIHPSGRYKRNTLHVILEENLGIKLFIIHRIDRETSGLV
ncbi:MAG: pseudouridine synthase, partial [Leptospiraceae bacterium]|nr:pseudouridine synthase [Leptospiraceae bacterium]